MLLLENPLNASPVIFPVIECFHIAGFVLAIGTIALVDFRLLDWVMPHQTPAQLTKDTSVWTLAGLMLVICSGLMIYSTDPDFQIADHSETIRSHTRFQERLVDRGPTQLLHIGLSRAIH